MNRNILLAGIFAVVVLGGGALVWGANRAADPAVSVVDSNVATTTTEEAAQVPENEVADTGDYLDPIPTPGKASTGNGIQVSAATGKAPFTVTITGPSELRARIQDCTYSQGWFGPSGNGLSIDWGDGTSDPQYSFENADESCTAAVQRHTYTAPGTYVIKARLWHPGPTDAPVTDWTGEVTVRVTG